MTLFLISIYFILYFFIVCNQHNWVYLHWQKEGDATFPKFASVTPQHYFLQSSLGFYVETLRIYIGSFGKSTQYIPIITQKTDLCFYLTLAMKY